MDDGHHTIHGSRLQKNTAESGLKSRLLSTASQVPPHSRNATKILPV